MSKDVRNLSDTQAPTAHEFSRRINDHIQASTGIEVMRDRITTICSLNRTCSRIIKMPLQCVLECLAIRQIIISANAEIACMFKFLLKLLGVKFHSALIFIMHEHCRTAHYYVEVVVVVAGDGEVPHPAVVSGRDRASDYDRCLAVRRLEVPARFEVLCRNPAVVQ
jgi:hypothetical protein